MRWFDSPPCIPALGCVVCNLQSEKTPFEAEFTVSRSENCAAHPAANVRTCLIATRTCDSRRSTFCSPIPSGTSSRAVNGRRCWNGARAPPVLTVRWAWRYTRARFHSRQHGPIVDAACTSPRSLGNQCGSATMSATCRGSARAPPRLTVLMRMCVVASSSRCVARWLTSPGYRPRSQPACVCLRSKFSMRPPDFRCLPEAGVRPIPHQSHRAHPEPIPHCRNAMNAAANGHVSR